MGFPKVTVGEIGGVPTRWAAASGDGAHDGSISRHRAGIPASALLQPPGSSARPWAACTCSSTIGFRPGARPRRMLLTGGDIVRGRSGREISACCLSHHVCRRRFRPGDEALGAEGRTRCRASWCRHLAKGGAPSGWSRAEPGLSRGEEVCSYLCSTPAAHCLQFAPGGVQLRLKTRARWMGARAFRLRDEALHVRASSQPRLRDRAPFLPVGESGGLMLPGLPEFRPRVRSSLSSAAPMRCPPARDRRGGQRGGFGVLVDRQVIPQKSPRPSALPGPVLLT